MKFKTSLADGAPKEILEEWHPTKNMALSPEDIGVGSNTKVWWKGKCGHEWESSPRARNIRGKVRGCPYCSGNKVSDYNSLASSLPDIARQWNYDRNGDLTPDMVTSKSGRKVWWRCSVNPKHEWRASVHHRSIGRGCPYCRSADLSAQYRKRFTKSLAEVAPDNIIKEWHPTKNGELTPDSIGFGSSVSVWWLCSSGHEWQASPDNRYRKGKFRNCPYCTGRYLSPEKSLAVLNPDLAREWNYQKNGSLTPDKVALNSNKKFWWRCHKNPKHEWLAPIYSRSQGQRCPYCSGRRVSEETSLLAVNPELAKEWHPTKNKELKPTGVTRGSHKKVWWKCSRNPEHEWQATVHSRSYGRGCPYCVSNLSRPQLRVFAELVPIFTDLEIHHKVDNLEFDMYCHEYRFAIEFDGYHWHKDNISKDMSKSKKAESSGIIVFRLRSNKLKPVSKHDILINENNLTQNDLVDLLGKISEEIELNNRTTTRIKKYKHHSDFWNTERYNELVAYYPGPLIGKTFKDTHPNLVPEWDIELNNGLLPENFPINSEQVIKWKCANGHTWNATIKARTKSKGCPYCSGRKVSKENNLAIVNPDLAQEWNHRMNSDLTPDKVTYKSQKKVWWMCRNNTDHEWQATVYDRSKGRGCPYCTGKLVSKEMSLIAANPKLAKEWHPTLNGDLHPYQVTSGSNKRVWWLCKSNPKHEWIASIKSRNRGTGCPICARSKVIKEKSLSKRNPELANEWHPTRNEELTPELVKPNSNKNVWWQCSKNKDHVWLARVKNRNNGAGCPICKSLQVRNPTLARQWHPTKNETLTPDQIGPGSKKKVWWQCDKNKLHVWQAQVSSRNQGKGCPFCAGTRKKE